MAKPGKQKEIKQAVDEPPALPAVPPTAVPIGLGGNRYQPPDAATQSAFKPRGNRSAALRLQPSSPGPIRSSPHYQRRQTNEPSTMVISLIESLLSHGIRGA